PPAGGPRVAPRDAAFSPREMSFMFRRVFTIAVLLMVALRPMVATAQAGSATISGAVKDATGGVLPGTTVRVINETSGTSVDVVTDGQGIYRVAALAAGQYRVE